MLPRKIQRNVSQETAALGRGHFTWLFAVMVFLALGSGPVQAWAQLSGATLSGRVSDAQNAIVPAATVVLLNNATGVGRTATSNASGLYTASEVQPGVYTVTVTSTGFSTFVERNVQLNVGTTRELNITLAVGSVDENVTVIAGSNDVQVDTSLVSATVGQKRIVELPLNGRDWTQLATLQPGVTNVRTQALTTSISANRATRGYGNQLTANGHSPYENTYLIDGVNENDYSNGAPGSPAGVNLGVDAIQEFSVVTTAYTAEYGRTSGAVINAVTRSGTNQVHGSAYVFDRDKIFDAKNPFDNPALPIPSFRRVQYGAAVGGPLRKDKTFLFGNYEALRQTQSLNLVDIVPSQAARTGMLHASTGALQPVTVSPSIVPFLALYPLPNGTLNAGNYGDTGNFLTTGRETIKEDFAIARLDNLFSAKDSLSLTFLYDNAPGSLPDTYNNFLTNEFDQRELGGISETHIFSANLLNVVRIGYNRNAESSLVPLKAFNPATVDTSLGYASNLNAPAISVTGLSTVGGFDSGRQSLAFYNSYQLNDDVAFTRGKHSMKFGFAAEQIRVAVNAPIKDGSATFLSLANFLTDRPYAAVTPAPSTSTPHTVVTLLAGYVQDDWRMREHLTVNLGLRYEFLTLPYDSKNQLGLINTLVGPAGSGPCPTIVSPTSVPGCTVPVSHYFQSNPTTHDFEPRIGFAYDVFGSGRTALRGAFGIYDMLPLPYLYQPYSSISSPFEQDRIGIGIIPPGSFPGGVEAVLNSLPATRLGHYIDPHPRRNYSLNYNLNVEQQLSKTISASIGYVGSHSVHQPFQTMDANIVAPSQVQVIHNRYLFPATGNTAQDANNSEILALFWDGSSHYSGLLTQLKVSGYHGLITQATYTWDKCIDYGPTQTPSTFTNTVAGLIYYDKQQRRGACDYVLAQNFSENTLYELPSPTAGFLKSALGGFQVGGIVTVSTGSPFTILNSGDVIGQKGLTTSSFPDFQPNCNPYNKNFKTNGRVYLNANCFSYPATNDSAIIPFCRTNPTPLTSGQVLCTNLQGNERRGQLIGPHLVDTDVSLIKNTRIPRISEAANLQLRVEAFNVFNHANYQAPTNNLTLGGRASLTTNGANLGSAGILDTTATPSRQIQLGAKLIF